MAIWKARIYSSVGGINVNDTISNEFLFRGNVASGDATFGQLATALFAKLASIQLSSIQLLRMTITEVRAKGAAKPARGTHMTFYTGLTGARAVPNGEVLGIKQNILVFGKSAANGYAGRQSIRGCLLQSELDASADGTLKLKAGTSTALFTAFANSIIALFSGFGFTYVLPAIKSADFDSGARPVNSVKYTGVSLQQLNNKHVSTETAVIVAAKREISDLQRKYDRARYGEGGIIQQITGVILQGLQAIASGIIDRYGINLILKLALPQGAGSIIRALPALGA